MVWSAGDPITHLRQSDGADEPDRIDEPDATDGSPVGSSLSVVGVQCSKEFEDDGGDDAYAFNAHTSTDEKHATVAISDGATVSFESGRWAQLLVEHFVADPFVLDGGSSSLAVAEWTREPAKRWRESVAGDDHPWHVREAARKGADATLLGVAFDERLANWTACAVGDACLFHIRDGWLLNALPAAPGDLFGATPNLLSTRPDRMSDLEEGAVTWMTAPFRAQDVLVLATDALAEWLLRQVQGVPNFGWMEWIANAEDDLKGFVEHARAHDGLARDDVTLVVVRRTQDQNE